MAASSKPSVADYQKIAAQKIQRPADTVDRLPRMLVYSRNKKGKTRFCTTAGVGKVLIADPEQGTKAFIQRNPHVWPITRWEDMDELYRFLKYGNHPYEWIAIDGMTRISNMALKWVMFQAEEHDLSRRPGMVQLKDYGKSGEIVKQMLYNFHDLPMGVIYTAQERQAEGTSSDDDEEVEDSSVVYIPDLPKGIRSAVNSLVDVIGRLYTVKLDEKIQRRLWVEPNVMYDTGYRSEFVLPAYIKNPTVPRLVKLMKEGTP